MAKRSSAVGWLVAGVTLLVGGVALAASSQRKQDPSAPPVPPDGNNEPLVDPSVEPKLWDQKAEAHKKGFAAAAQQFAEWGRQKREEDQVDAEFAKERTAAAAAVTAVGGTVASFSGPIAGPVIAAIAAGIAAMVRYVRSYGGIIVGGNRLEFTGWRDNSYDFRDIPIYGPEAERFWEVCQRVMIRAEQLDALKALVAAYPNGPGPSEVAISSTGDFDYLFNPSRPGDLSQPERDAKHVFGQQVYSPADVTLRGPRGFDPTNPRSWKVAGERASIYDRVVKADPNNPASGM